MPRQTVERESEQRIRFAYLARTVTVVLLVVAATLQMANMLFVLAEDPDVTWAVPVSDLGRDVIGFRAARDGKVPYGPLTDFDPSVPTEARAWWVAHTPAAIAVAGVLDHLPWPPERSARALIVLGLVGVALALAAVGGTLGKGWPLGAAGLAMIPAWTDFMWVQLGTVTAVVLLAALHLDRSERRRAAFILLGVLVAWRPWLAPLVLALPKRGRLWRDLSWVALGGVVATAVALPFTGGLGGFITWLTVAAPTNLAQYRQTIGNLSVTQWMGDTPAWLMFAVGYISVLMSRVRMVRELRLVMASVVIFTLSLLVWSHYWSVLVVALLPAMGMSRRWRNLIAGVVGMFALAMLTVLTGMQPLAAAVNGAGALATLILSVGLMWQIVDDMRAGANPQERNLRESRPLAIG